MTERNEVGEAAFKITADISDYVTKLEEAKKGLKTHRDFVDQATAFMAANFGERLLVAVKDFVVQSVKEYARLDKAITQVVNNSRRFGNATMNLRGDIESYLDTLEATTKFQDIELAESLNKILFVTKDLSAATYLNKVAMDLAGTGAMELTEASELMAAAYRGDERAVMTVARALGIQKTEGLKVSDLLTEITNRSKDASKETDNLGDSFSALAKEMGNWGEFVGGKSKGFFTNIATEAKNASMELRGALLGDEAAGDSAAIARFEANIKVMQKELELAKARKAPAAEVARYENAIMENQVQLLPLLEKRQKALKKIADEEARGKKIVDEHAESVEWLKTVEKHRADAKAEIDAEQKEREDESQRRFDKLIASWERLGDVVAKDTSKSFEEFFTLVKSGTVTTKQAFEELAKSMQKSLLGAIATWLEQLAASHYAQAAAAIYFEDYKGAALQALGASLLVAAAGGVRAVAAGLADGGFSVGGETRRDTIPVMIRKNEMVTPLDDPKAVTQARKLLGNEGSGGGGGLYISQLVVPGGDRASGRSAAMSIMAEEDRARARRGRKRARGKVGE